MRGREHFNEYTAEGLKKMLFDDYLEAREACGWTLNRICCGRDGVDIINQWKLTADLIKSFLKYSEGFKDAEAKFLIYLLEAFGYILE